MIYKTFASEFAAYFGLSRRGDGGDLTRFEEFAASVDSANYMMTHMSQANRFANDQVLLSAAISRITINDGPILEFGVYSGRTINHIASTTPNRQVYGFDSFQGLPEDWRPGFGRGSFNVSNLPPVPPNVELVVGWFDETVPRFVRGQKQQFSLIHVDCDLYSSTKTIFHHLQPLIGPGTIIVFDEYFNYVGWRNHEYKAFKEYIEESQLRYEYFGVVPMGQQAGVIIR